MFNKILKKINEMLAVFENIGYTFFIETSKPRA